MRLTPAVVASLPQTDTVHAADGVALSVRHDPALTDPAFTDPAFTDPALTDPALTDPGAGPRELAFVVVHGFTGSWRRPELRAIVERLRRHGGVVSLDLRGHGASQGRATVGATEHADVTAALAWARSLGYRKVVTVGFSLGSVVALRQAGLDREQAPDAVVAVSPASRWNYRGTAAMRRLHLGMLTPMGRSVLARWYGTRVAADGWEPPPPPPDVVASQIDPTTRLLVVHGDDDPYLPVEHALWLVEVAGAPATLWLEAGMGHAEGATSPELVDRIADWARQVVAAESRSRPGTSARMRA